MILKIVEKKNGEEILYFLCFLLLTPLLGIVELWKKKKGKTRKHL